MPFVRVLCRAISLWAWWFWETQPKQSGGIVSRREAATIATELQRG